MHLYIHVPFCKRRCSYCDFAIAVRKQVPGDEFVEAIKREFELRVGSVDTGGRLDTLYFGGGTPSLLSNHQLAELIRFFGAELGLADGGVEITVEANPDDVTEEAVDAWIGAGVNRFSVGVQSLKPDVLEWMHRPHTRDDCFHALHTLTVAGAESVSVDVIFGLPAELGADPVDDVQRLMDCGPDHFSAYGLTVESGTPLAKWMNRGAVKSVSDEKYADEFLRLHDLLTGPGFEHYEVSNYALPNKRSRHNQVYWSGKPYLGLGPSAHSFGAGVRRWNLREWAEYQLAMRAGADPVAGEETLTPEQRLLERWYLGLRTVTGVKIGRERGAGSGPRHTQAVGGERGDRLWATIQVAVDEGWLVVREGRVCATPAGWLRLDAIVASLTTSLEGG